MRCSSLHKSSSFRRTFVQHIACLSLLLGGLIAPVRAADSQPRADATVDHPILVVAAASIDRLLERTATLMESAGRDASPEAIRKLRAIIDPMSASTMKGIDTTKPIGLLTFFTLNVGLHQPNAGESSAVPAKSKQDSSAEILSKKKAASDAAMKKKSATEATKKKIAEDDSPCDDAPDKSDSDKPEPTEPGVGIDSEGNSLDMLGGIMDEANQIGLDRAVVAIPMKNFDELIASLGLTRVEGEPFAYDDESGNTLGVRRSGDYLLIGSDPDLVAHTADPRSLLRSVLGKQDVAVSFQTKGLPVGLRMLGAEGIKSVYAAMLQQRDDEPAHEYKLRRALGDLQLELLDLAVSQIDEVNLGLRLDPNKREFVIEFDLAGPPDGKLAKFAAEWTPKRSPFAGLWQEDGTMSLGLSLAIPERHAKPIAAALRERVKQFGLEDGEELGPYGPLVGILNVGTKLIESGQLDLLMTSTGSGENGSAILGIKVPGGPKFPEQFQKYLELWQLLEWSDSKSWSLAVDAVNGYPVHRLTWGMMDTLFGFGISGFDQSPGFSIAATPDALWLASTGKDNPEIVPDLLKLAVEHVTSKPARAAASTTRKISPLRMTFHTREIKIGESTSEQPDNEADPKVRQVKGEAAEKVRRVELQRAEKQKREWEIIQTFFQEKGDAIHAELRPTSTGLKLTVQLEEALVATFGRAMGFAVDAELNDDE